MGNKFLITLKKVLKTPRLMSKYIICFTAVMHLVISHIQIQSIALLNDQICGFTMFFFILFGFACLFNAIRMNQITLKKWIISLLMLCITMGFGIWLVIIYFSSLGTQVNLELNEILPGIVVSIIVLVLYLIGMIELIVGYFVERKQVKEVLYIEDEIDSEEEFESEEKTQGEN